MQTIVFTYISDTHLSKTNAFYYFCTVCPCKNNGCWSFLSKKFEKTLKKQRFAIANRIETMSFISQSWSPFFKNHWFYQSLWKGVLRCWCKNNGFWKVGVRYACKNNGFYCFPPIETLFLQCQFAENAKKHCFCINIWPPKSYFFHGLLVPQGLRS